MKNYSFKMLMLACFLMIAGQASAQFRVGNARNVGGVLTTDEDTGQKHLITTFDTGRGLSSATPNGDGTYDISVSKCRNEKGFQVNVYDETDAAVKNGDFKCYRYGSNENPVHVRSVESLDSILDAYAANDAATTTSKLIPSHCLFQTADGGAAFGAHPGKYKKVEYGFYFKFEGYGVSEDIKFDIMTYDEGMGLNGATAKYALTMYIGGDDAGSVIATIADFYETGSGTKSVSLADAFGVDPSTFSNKKVYFYLTTEGSGTFIADDVRDPIIVIDNVEGTFNPPAWIAPALKDNEIGSNEDDPLTGVIGEESTFGILMQTTGRLGSLKITDDINPKTFKPFTFLETGAVKANDGSGNYTVDVPYTINQATQDPGTGEWSKAQIEIAAPSAGAVDDDFMFYFKATPVGTKPIKSRLELDCGTRVFYDVYFGAPKKVAYVTLDKEMDASASMVSEDPIITMLKADANLVVDVLVVAADADLGDLSGYAVVIAQESFGSSSAIFAPGGSLGMGSIPVPFILNKAYTMKAGRGFAADTPGSGGENGNVRYLMASTDNQVNDLFKGLTFVGDSIQLFRATANDDGSVGGTKALQFAKDVVISAPTVYDFRDGSIITNQESADGKLKLGGAYGLHGDVYGLNMKTGNQIEIAVDGDVTIKFLGSEYSSLSMTAATVGSAGTITPAGPIATVVVNDLSDYYTFEYTGGAETLIFTAVADGAGQNSDIYLPIIEVMGSGHTDATLIASGTMDPAEATVCLNDIPAGSTIGSETLQARMIAMAMNFGAISKDRGTNFTSEGLTIWRNAVYSLAGIDVPSNPVDAPDAATKKVAYVTLDKEMDATATTVTDDAIIRMLQEQELVDVTVLAVAADADLGDLSMYDAVVAQESFGSSSAIFAPGGSLGMGSIPVPFILNKAYTMKAGRGFAADTPGSGGENGNVNYLRVAAENQGNDLFKGITFDADTIKIFRAFADDAGAAGGTKALQFASNVEITAENTLLASGSMDPAEATVCVNDIPAGDTIGSEILQARMIAMAMNFGAISKNQGTNFTSEGLTIWRNAVLSLVGLDIPDEMVEAPAAAAMLMHSYTFEVGDTAIDVVAGANGSLTGGMVKDGKFTSAAGGYVELPAGDIAINTYPTVSFEMYIAESESAPTNSMAFYLGGSPNDLGGNGTFVATNHWNGPATRAGISTGEEATPWTKESAVTTDPLSVPGMTHVVTTIDADSIKLFINGVQAGSDALATMSNSIAALSNDFAWIARGGYAGDPTWLGSISEFNIYEGALTDEEIAENAANWPEDAITPRSVAYVTADKTMDDAASPIAEDPIIKVLMADENIDITVMVVAADSVLGDLSMYDAVVVQEGFGSGSAILKPGASLGLASIPVPFVYNKMYGLRSGKALTSGDGASHESSNLSYMVDAANQANDLFKAITFVGDTFPVFRSTYDDSGAEGVKSLNYNTGNAVSGDNTLIGSPNGVADAVFGINDVPAGTIIDSDTTISRMIAVGMNFGAISGDMGTNFTNEGLTFWRNMIYSLVGIAVPEEGVIAPDPTPKTGLMHSYTFEDGTADDVIGDVHGTLNGSMISIADGMATVAGATASTDGYISLDGAKLALNTYDAITLEAYLQTEASANSSYTMLAYFGNNTGGDRCLWIQPTRAATETRVEANNGTATVNALLDGTEIDDGKKHHLVAILTADTLAYYIDGVVVASTVTGGDYITTLDTVVANIFKGADGWADPNYNASLAEFNIYNGVLTAEEVFANAKEWIPTVAVNKVESANGVMVYPNPASDFAKVAFTLTESASVSLSVYNMLGQKVNASSTTMLNAGSNDMNIETQNLENGMYIYRLEVGGMTYQGKFNISK